MKAKSTRKWLLALPIGLCAMAASAHHSVAAYDFTKSVTLKGTVKVFQWTNPHNWIEIEVPNESGDITRWICEAGIPNVNMRMGWKKDDVHVGDVVTATIHPKRDGTPGGTLELIQLPDGRTLRSPVASLKSAEASPPARE